MYANEVGLGGDTFLTALDYKTGKTIWRVKYPAGGGGAAGFLATISGPGAGILTTAGGLLFAGDAGGNIVARDVGNGKPIWHARVGNLSNAPETYRIDGKQYLLIATGDTLYAFALYSRP